MLVLQYQKKIIRWFLTFDYANFGEGLLELGKIYKVCIGFKTAALAKYLEPDLADNTLKITQDCIRN